MKAEKIYNKAVDELTAIAKECIQQIAQISFTKGIADIIRYEVDPWEFKEDGDNLIVWSDDYYDTVGVDVIDINCITMDNEAKNIYISGTNGEEVLFANLPMNSMVFVCGILENILKKERGE